MKTQLFFAASIIVFAGVSSADNPEFETTEGGALYLNRLGFETHRAEFIYAADCEHVAKIMNEAEPLVDWYCSTSVPDINLSCSVRGVSVDAPPEVKAEVTIPESFEFKLRLNRGKAFGISEDYSYLPLDFDYTQSADSFLLTSDYPYASGNYFTMAVYTLRINTSGETLEVLDIGGKTNGIGNCRLQ
ncbi:MAG: hypothetical protein GTN99_01525 [Candidatus Dadabacteria bacterium]|nr:hypothetical protein [Candidatus Dadabacteria bacterium]